MVIRLLNSTETNVSGPFPRRYEKNRVSVLYEELCTKAEFSAKGSAPWPGRCSIAVLTINFRLEGESLFYQALPIMRAVLEMIFAS